MIHTKIHKLIAKLKDPTCTNSTMSPERVAALANLFTNHPHYVITDELAEALHNGNAFRTVDALLQMGVARMPHLECVVEFSCNFSNNQHGTAFMWLGYDTEEPTDKDWVSAYTAYLLDDGAVVGWKHLYKIRPSANAPGSIGEDGYQYHYDWEVKSDDQKTAQKAVIALVYLLTLTHTQGVVGEKVTEADLSKLNKSRAAKGQVTIPAYTVFKVTHTHDASGKKVVWHPGSKMRPHLRAGHLRHQPCGTGRKERKVIFVEPCLVNCADASDVKHIPKICKV